MLYDEFVKGTGCSQNDHNYDVFKKLEILYMETDMTKEEIYEWGKKLVNNEPTEEQKRIIAQWEAELAGQRERAKDLRADIKYYTVCKKAENDPYWVAEYTRLIKARKEWLKRANALIREYRMLLNK